MKVLMAKSSSEDVCVSGILQKKSFIFCFISIFIFIFISGNGYAGGKELKVTPATKAIASDLMSYEVNLKPGNFLTVGSITYFAGTDGTCGRELWRTDGTSGGTYMVCDIFPGANSPSTDLTTTVNNSNPVGLTLINNNLLFFANDGSHGYELWKTDGTSAGTQMLKDIRPGPANSASPGGTANVYGNMYDYFYTATLNGLLYFAADDDVNGEELWCSDGTPEGTKMAVNISPNDYSFPDYLVTMGNYIYFSARNGYLLNGTELWRSDGTPAGTTMVADINPGKSSSDPRELTVVGNKLFFTANNGTTGRELWVSDGTQSGTHLVMDIVSGTSNSNPSMMTAVGDTLYFVANDGTHGYELWKSDGTTAEMVQDILAGSESSQPDQLTNLNGTLIFSANDGTNGLEPWVCTGSTASLLKDIKSGSGSSVVHYRWTNTRFFTCLNDKVIFSANSSSKGELWATDGTTLGTTLLAEINDISNYALNIGVSGNRVWFGSPYDLWSSDGTVSGTALVCASKQIPGLYPRHLVNCNGIPCFSGYSDEYGIELWKTGAAGGEVTLIKNIYSDESLGATGSNPAGLTPFGNIFLFGFYDTWSRGIWKSDGTTAGTSALSGSCITEGPFTIVGTNAFCTNADKNQLWVTDGTIAGTKMIKKYDDYFTSISNMTAFNGKLYYQAGDSQIWSSDGTVAGTAVAVDFFSSGALSTSLATGKWTVVGSSMFLTASSSGKGYELWKTDGTNAGTAMVKDIYSGSLSSYPDYYLEMNGKLYFSANVWMGGEFGRELICSDGTADGTKMIKDIFPGVAESSPEDFVKAGNFFYFTAVTSEHGRELWRSDGTAEGTFMIKDINPGTGGSCPHAMYYIESQKMLVFAAYTPERGVELWLSNGTNVGTWRGADINPGTGNSNPSDFLAIGNTMFFRGMSGTEVTLYSSDISNLPVTYTESLWMMY